MGIVIAWAIFAALAIAWLVVILKRYRRDVVNAARDDLGEMFTTQVKHMLTCGVLAVLLESFQEQVVFGETILSRTIMIFLMAAIVFVVVFAYYRQKQ